MGNPAGVRPFCGSMRWDATFSSISEKSREYVGWIGGHLSQKGGCSNGHGNRGAPQKILAIRFSEMRKLLVLFALVGFGTVVGCEKKEDAPAPAPAPAPADGTTDPAASTDPAE